MGDDQRGAADQQPREAALDARLCGDVDARRRLVEHEDAGLDDYRPRERNELALAAGESLAALADLRAQTVGQALEHLERVDGFGGGPHVVNARAGPRPADVVSHAAGDKNGSWLTSATWRARCEIELGEVDAV